MSAEPLSPRLPTQQIGKLGELLVQYELLRHGLESAPMTTDSGIDLVVYSQQRGRSFTVQVKANHASKPAGGRGAPTLDWWLPTNCPAEYCALVDLSTRRVWLFTTEQFCSTAQQSSSGRHHLYMYVQRDGAARPKTKHPRSVDTDFAEFLIEKQIPELFL